ncbi:unnamed protein product [Orchesella dallaii]|uniref:Uncharacterized protein n=1 Tax=Orchesella dallaii TaxID=48710 RepID=A0ABP1QPC3_9HEXA
MKTTWALSSYSTVHHLTTNKNEPKSTVHSLSVRSIQNEPQQLSSVFTNSKPTWFSKLHSFNMLSRSSREVQSKCCGATSGVPPPSPPATSTHITTHHGHPTLTTSFIRYPFQSTITTKNTTPHAHRGSVPSTSTTTSTFPIFHKRNLQRLCPTGQSFDSNGNCRSIIRF